MPSDTTHSKPVEVVLRIAIAVGLVTFGLQIMLQASMETAVTRSFFAMVTVSAVAVAIRATFLYTTAVALRTKRPEAAANDATPGTSDQAVGGDSQRRVPGTGQRKAA